MNSEVNQLLASLGQSISVLDTNGRVESVSGSMEKILGYQAHERIGQFALDFVHPSDKSQTVSAFIEVLEGKRTIRQLTVRATHRDGTVRPLLITFRLHTTANLEQRILISAQLLPSLRTETSELHAWADPENFGELDEAVEALRATSRLPDPARTGRIGTTLRSAASIFDADAILVAVASKRDPTKVHVVRGLARISPASNVTHEKSASQAGTMLANGADQHEYTTSLIQPAWPTTLKLPDNARQQRRFAHWLTSSKPIDPWAADEPTKLLLRSLCAQIGDQFTNGNVLAIPCDWSFARGLVMISSRTDSVGKARLLAGHVTESVAAGVASWRYRVAVTKQSEARFETLLGLATDLVLVLNSSGGVQYASPAAIRMFGLDDHVDRTDPHVLDSNRRLRESVATTITNALAQTAKPGDRVQGRTEVTPISGETITLGYSVTNLTDNQQIKGWLINATDISERVEAERDRDRNRRRRDMITVITAQLAASSPETIADDLQLPLNQICKLTKSETALLEIIMPGRGQVSIEQTLSTEDVRCRDSDGLDEISTSIEFDSAWRGQITIRRSKAMPYTDSERGFVDSVTATISSALSRCAAGALLVEQANTDELTGLANRRHLGEHLALLASPQRSTRHEITSQTITSQAITSQARTKQGQAGKQLRTEPGDNLRNEKEGGAAIIYIDLDEFKLVNDSLGHDAGDELLLVVSERLKAAAPRHAVVARVGGDEFVLLIPRAGEHLDLRVIAEGIRQSLFQPVAIRGTTLHPSAAIGIGFATGSEIVEHGSSILMSRADLALLDAKKLGNGTIKVFSSDMAAIARKQLELVTALDQAIADRAFTLSYQPIFDTSPPHRLRSLEALIRWNHNGIAVPPDEFIPIAERSGRIGLITSFVLKEGLQQLVRWHTNSVVSRDVSISLNLSGHDLKSPALSGVVQAALRHVGLPPESLHLEVTETSALELAPALANLHRLRNLQIGLSLDDFGTGYASLSYLRDVPATVVKIDRSFVCNITEARDRRLIAAAIAMSHELGMDVVAEGVETEEQLAVLQELGCDMVQGYLLGRPLPPTELECWLRVHEQRSDWPSSCGDGEASSIEKLSRSSAMRSHRHNGSAYV